MSTGNTELWISGNVTVPEAVTHMANGNTLEYTTGGVSVMLQPKASAWFHMPIPTPAVLGTKRATLTWVTILFSIETPMLLERVVVMEALNNIFDKNVSVTGDHQWGGDNENTYNVGRNGIQFGVNISLFLTNGAPDKKKLFIVGAGANFQHDCW